MSEVRTECLAAWVPLILAIRTAFFVRLVDDPVVTKRFLERVRKQFPAAREEG